jgi:DNA-binding NarL/FixJ family response regulator
VRTLFVEDNPKKREQLIGFYEAEFPSDEITQATALIPGLRLAREIKPELIVLDMTLPNYSVEDSKGAPVELLPFAGKEFVMRVSRMKIDVKVIIVSMFETFGILPNLITLNSLDAELRSRFPGVYIRAVHYNPSQPEWKSAIRDARVSLIGR